MSSTHDVSTYFNAHWQRYKDAVGKNLLFHREMFMALNQFLDEQMHDRNFTLVDVGCGDSSSIAPVLAHKSIKKYIGIDAADNVLKLAASNLASIQCDKEFISEDMSTAIHSLKTSVDIIFTSYAVHHLTTQDKIKFISDCKAKLTDNGFLLMVDGVLEPEQSRNEWLKGLEDRFRIVHPEITEEDLKERMEHPNSSDLPDEIKVFATIASDLNWKHFQVLVDKGIFAFMVFAK